MYSQDGYKLISAEQLIGALPPLRSLPLNQFPRNAKVYVNNIGGFGSYLAAAFQVKGVPITVVMDRRQADFEIVGTSESKDPNWAEVIFLKHGHPKRPRQSAS